MAVYRQPIKDVHVYHKHRSGSPPQCILSREYKSIVHIPFCLITASQTTYSVKASFSYTTGGTASETTSDTIQVGVSVLPQSVKSATVTSNRYTIDVPFEATVTPVFPDESEGTPYRFTGLYEGVQMSDVTVVYGPDIPVPVVPSSEGMNFAYLLISCGHA